MKENNKFRICKEKTTFDYNQAFQRNIGFITEEEQTRLRNARIAVAGLGGTGGAQVQALARLGIGRFTLADPDIFELVNFNRQVGATVDSIGRKKAEVTQEQILAINSEASIQAFGEGLHEKNIDAFLEEVDVVIDSLDFYAFDARFLLHQKAREKGIWVINVAPSAIGATVLVFDPQGMSFQDYFNFRKGMSDSEKFLTMFCGTNPSFKMALGAMKYLSNGKFLKKMNQASGKSAGLPCIGPVFYLTASLTAIETLNLLIRKLPPKAVPYVFQMDAMVHQSVLKRYRWGMKSPWQKLKKICIAKMIGKKTSPRQESVSSSLDPEKNQGTPTPSFSPEKDMIQNIEKPGKEAIQLHRQIFKSSEEMREKVRELSKITVWKGLFGIAEDWVIIIACFSVTIHFPHPLIWILAAFVVGARQHGFLIMGHDAVHYRIFNDRKWNDRIADWLLAYPMFATTQALRRDHLAHHFYLFTDKDTEEMRKRGRPGWSFPVSKTRFFWELFRDLTGRSMIPFLKFLLTKNPDGMNPDQKIEQAIPSGQKIERILYYVLAVILISFFNLWIPVFFLWILPAFTVLPAIFRIRNIARHFGIPREHDLNMSRNTINVPAWEQFLIGPHHVGYHLDHHLYPSVPWYNLPKLHEELMKIEDYAKNAYESNSYLGFRGKSVLVDVTTKGKHNDYQPGETNVMRNGTMPLVA